MAHLRDSEIRMNATKQRVDAWMAALAPAEEVVINTRGALAGLRGRIEVAQAFRPLSREIAWRPRYLALALHAAAFAMLTVGVTSPQVQERIRETITVFDPNLKPYTPRQMSGGGGGGAKELSPVSQGQAPKPALRQFTPPMIVDHTPKLEVQPTIIAPPDTVLPQSNVQAWGDPLAKLMTGSNGSGTGGGMGDGCCGGLGIGHGVGYGPGDLAGIRGGVYSTGAGVSMPVVLSKVEPEYSEEARKAKYSGMVQLEVIVDTEGRVRDVRVVKSLGMGLDEKAAEAVAKWKFRPGIKNGQAVNTRARVDVSFRLL
jgi:periplasmic protein TonB